MTDCDPCWAPLAPRAVLTLALAVSALALVAGTDSTVPGHPDVLAEYIGIPGTTTPGTPAGLDRVDFLRLRAISGGDAPPAADAILIGQPGFASTPGLWLELGAQLVEKAETRGRVVEVWVVDRRGSNLEDTNGLRDSLADEDPFLAVDYYYGDILTPAGRFPVGLPDALLGRPDAQFRVLADDDVPFVAEWGFEAVAGDVEAMMNLLPEESQADTVFLAGHSQGGGFVALMAGRRMASGVRATERVAGLVFIDGGPSIGGTAAPDPTDVDQHVAAVADIRSGETTRFGSNFGPFFLGAGLGVQGSVQGHFAGLAPEDESIFLLFPFVAALSAGDLFRTALRVTNRAYSAFTIDDDPIPGTFLQTPSLVALGGRVGHLDFIPLPGTENDCAAPGPLGDMPPCAPSQSQIDPDAVYDWLDGGGNGAAGPDGPLNGWTTFDDGKSFTDDLLEPGENPSTAAVFIASQFFAPKLSNIAPVTVMLPVAGRQTIHSNVMNGLTWYASNRYNLDLGFLGRFQTIAIDTDGIAHDIDKTAIAAPVYSISGSARENPYPLVTDFTSIHGAGVDQSKAAAELSPIEATLNSSLYRHQDYLYADDSLAGSVTPGQPGANLTSQTLIDWMLARSAGTAAVPTPKELGVESIFVPEPGMAPLRALALALLTICRRRRRLSAGPSTSRRASRA